VLGLASSFEALTRAAAGWDFAHPWMLPLGIDIAIPTFTLANLLLIRMDMRLAWVRMVPWALTAATCWLNITAGSGLGSKVAHGLMPLLWVVLSEIAAHVYAVRIGLATGRRMERIRRSRWLLAPASTFGLWRRMVLWETTSYTDALARERERQLARAELRETYGRNWRRTAPRRTRILLKLGDTTPTGSAPSLVICGSDMLAVPEVPARPRPKAESAEPKRPAARRPAKAKTPPKRTDAEVLAEARMVTAEWADAALTADRLRTALRIAPKRAQAVRDTLRAEREEAAVPVLAGVAS
jgi:hypothetical protein